MLARACSYGSILLALAPTAALAAPIESQPADVGGTPTQAITWTDAHGQPRTVHVLTDNHRIVRYAYTVGGEPVVDDEVPDYGIGNLVHHGACGATVSWEGEQEYVAQAVLEGPHHYVWRSTFRLPMCDHPEVSWRVTNEYLFVTGEDHFIQTVAYDSSDLPASEPMNDDMRGPYNQTTWPGAGDITGFGFGTQHRFVTTGPIPDGDANVGGGVAVPWEWTEPNSIPYVWEWADPAQGGAVDREYGVVQNLRYDQQDFGGGFYGCGTDCFASTPPLTGTALPASWAMPSQMSAYDSNYRSGRITWGATYGTFENGHSNDTGTIPDMGDRFRPINAWSWTHVVGPYSEGGVMARVADTLNVQNTTLVAPVGTVVTSGPRGPGDFVGPEVGSMPTIDYSPVGYDPVYRTWNAAVEASTSGTFHTSLTMTVPPGGLVRPVLVVHDFPPEGESVELDAEMLAAEAGYYASYDAATSRLWVTLDRTLEGGTNHIILVRSDGSSTDDGGSSGSSTGGSLDDTGGNPGGGTALSSGPSNDGTAGGLDEGSNDGGMYDEGCGCRGAPSGPERGSAPWLVGLLALPALRRRRAACRRGSLDESAAYSGERASVPHRGEQLHATRLAGSPLRPTAGAVQLALGSISSTISPIAPASQRTSNRPSP